MIAIASCIVQTIMVCFIPAGTIFYTSSYTIVNFYIIFYNINLARIVELLLFSGQHGRLQELVKWGLEIFLYPGGEAHPLRLENPLESIDFTDPGGRLWWSRLY